MSVTVQPGTYDGTVTEATIYEAPSGAVMCQMRVDIEGTILRGGICLVQKDGTLSERGFNDVKAILGWSDWDWAKWEADPASFAGAAVQVVVETVQGEKGEFSSIKYLNPPGGGGATLVKADAKNLAAKYGAKTRALFGGTTPKPPAPKTPPKAPPKAAKAVKPSSMEKCWDEFCKANEGKDETALYEAWAALIQKAAGKEQNDCTPEDWGKVYSTFDLLPME